MYGRKKLQFTNSTGVHYISFFFSLSLNCICCCENLRHMLRHSSVYGRTYSKHRIANKSIWQRFVHFLNQITIYANRMGKSNSNKCVYDLHKCFNFRVCVCDSETGQKKNFYYNCSVCTVCDWTILILKIPKIRLEVFSIHIIELRKMSTKKHLKILLIDLFVSSLHSRDRFSKISLKVGDLNYSYRISMANGISFHLISSHYRLVL